MEGGCEVRSADAEEDAHAFADIGFERFGDERIRRAVEDKVLGVFVEQFGGVTHLMTMFTECASRINFALHDIELAVHFGESAFGFDEDETVHAVGNVLGNHWGRAVIHEQTGVERFGSENGFLTGFGLGHNRAAARTGDCVKVYRVVHGAGHAVLHVDFDGVTDAHAEEWTRDKIVERPVGVGGAVGKLTDDFSRFEVDAHNLWFAVANGTGQVARLADDVCAGVIRFLCNGSSIGGDSRFGVCAFGQAIEITDDGIDLIGCQRVSQCGGHHVRGTCAGGTFGGEEQIRVHDRFVQVFFNVCGCASVSRICEMFFSHRADFREIGPNHADSARDAGDFMA